MQQRMLITCHCYTNSLKHAPAGTPNRTLMAEFQDIIETSETPPILVWWQWAALFLAIVGLIALILFVLKRSQHSRTTKQGNLGVALESLQKIDLSTCSSNQLASSVSVIVREYLQRQFSDSALFETDEEFHERSKQLDILPDQAAEKLRAYLADLSKHKYAPNHNHPKALEGFVDKAAELLKGLDSTVPRPLTSG